MTDDARLRQMNNDVQDRRIEAAHRWLPCTTELERAAVQDLSKISRDSYVVKKNPSAREMVEAWKAP
jgi:hypothetical protein